MNQCRLQTWKVLVSMTSRQSIVACTQPNISFGFWWLGSYLLSLSMQWNYTENRKYMLSGKQPKSFFTSKYCRELNLRLWGKKTPNALSISIHFG